LAHHVPTKGSHLVKASAVLWAHHGLPLHLQPGRLHWIQPALSGLFGVKIVYSAKQPAPGASIKISGNPRIDAFLNGFSPLIVAAQQSTERTNNRRSCATPVKSTSISHEYSP
jgi:hypothetical protein